MPGVVPTVALTKTEAQTNTGLLASHGLLHRAVTIGLALLFPPRCAGCNRVDSYWCARCQDALAQLPYAPLQQPLAPLAKVASSAVHAGKVQTAIHALKYENGRQLALPLGERLANLLTTLDWTVDMIVPVPLHTTRLRERGYNQSQLLSEVVAAKAGIPCAPTALQRLQYTRSQVGLSATERQSNLEAAFQADAAQVTNQILVLIDDVYTTGATLSACAEAALTAGAQAVYGLTVSTAHGRFNL